jgi:7-cyano-7-deazaguanine synthase
MKKREQQSRSRRKRRGEPRISRIARISDAGRSLRGAKVRGAIEKAVVLLSGGMDSATLVHYVKKSLGVPVVYTLSVAYGQKHARELAMARWQAESAGVTEHIEADLSCFARLTAGKSALTDAAIRVPDLAEIGAADRRQPVTYVPNRNMVLLALAAACAEARGVPDVFFGAQKQDEYGYWDCTTEFVERLNAALGLNRGRPVRVHAPFAALRKADVLRLGLSLGVDYGHTWSCYRGGRGPCGACPSCVERETAFREVKGTP